MRIFIRGIVFLLVIISLVSCKKTLKPEELPSSISIGATYYTQFVIRYEKGTHLTSNFRRGDSIPVNTPVRLLTISSKAITVELLNPNQKLVVKNVEKHTGDDVYRAFDKLFAKKKINLSKFTPLEKAQIDNGTVAIGMRKEAVIVAIGYPPITETSNLNSNQWIYWSGRFNKFKLHFKDGKVSGIED
ncbi:MAG: hypothetical protein NTV43_02410 [Methylococcales bacterium]|nr:hypothetical protein [Methylococcales bacterium]